MANKIKAIRRKLKSYQRAGYDGEEIMDEFHRELANMRRHDKNIGKNAYSFATGRGGKQDIDTVTSCVEKAKFIVNKFGTDKADTRAMLAVDMVWNNPTLMNNYPEDIASELFNRFNNALGIT